MTITPNRPADTTTRPRPASPRTAVLRARLRFWVTRTGPRLHRGGRAVLHLSRGLSLAPGTGHLT